MMLIILSFFLQLGKLMLGCDVRHFVYVVTFGLTIISFCPYIIRALITFTLFVLGLFTSDFFFIFIAFFLGTIVILYASTRTRETGSYQDAVYVRGVGVVQARDEGEYARTFRA
ncbi:hypothetical protein P280DRAFT_521433 [Massarina eburnea CBS 473.64]|uniref:Uncharacterized protein n=1 Tax=Massarina eburnea CBS 473.64 TaxID=1395130 RepID=A0A6A6RSC8_9PLEO|nr:hypothetical protein P280DRAFT_521433 [Massarina eburnea CBS 473.64]